MAEGPILLEVLLRQRQWHRYGAFMAQYNSTAGKVDRALVGTCPSRAQLHRWLSGQLKRLPYVDHCRVLEAMLPGWTAEQLFAPCPPGAPDETRVHEPRGVESPSLSNRDDGPLIGVATSPVSIRPHVERAFQHEDVAIDFFGFSGETLHGVIQEPLDTIRSGQLKPRTLAIRLLVPDTSAPMTVPCRADDLSDDPDFRARAGRIMLRHGQAILDAVQELADLHMVEHATAEIRIHGVPPLFKLYILNREETFFGFYPIKEHTVTISSKPHPVFDLMGKDASLFHHSMRDGGPVSAQYVNEAQQWYDTIWETISREHTG